MWLKSYSICVNVNSGYAPESILRSLGQNQFIQLTPIWREKVAMGDKSPKNKEKRKKKQDNKKKPIIPTSPVKSIDQKK